MFNLAFYTCIKLRGQHGFVGNIGSSYSGNLSSKPVADGGKWQLFLLSDRIDFTNESMNRHCTIEPYW